MYRGTALTRAEINSDNTDELDELEEEEVEEEGEEENEDDELTITNGPSNTDAGKAMVPGRNIWNANCAPVSCCDDVEVAIDCQRIHLFAIRLS